jgi:hypothetical protein
MPPGISVRGRDAPAEPVRAARSALRGPRQVLIARRRPSKLCFSQPVCQVCHQTEVTVLETGATEPARATNPAHAAHPARPPRLLRQPKFRAVVSTVPFPTSPPRSSLKATETR